MTDATKSSEELEQEVEALRSEVANLKKDSKKQREGGGVRKTASAFLVILTILSFFVASTSYWARRNFLNTNVWIERVAPLADDPAVQASVANQITTEVMSLVKPEELFKQVLPERGQILAGPLTSALRGFVHDKVLEFVKTPTFKNLWVRANERAHSEAVAVLEGEKSIIAAKSDRVEINFIPVINDVLADISTTSPELFGRTVTIPKVTVDQVPEQVKQSIANALGVKLPANFGVVTVYDAGKLKAAQDAVRMLNNVFMASVILTIILIPLTLFVSHRRRRTALQMLVGGSIVIILVRRVVMISQNEALSYVREGDKNAASVIMHAFTDPLMHNSGWILTGLLTAVVLLLITGPYSWAKRLRSGTTNFARAAWRAVVNQTTDQENIEWITKNRIGVQIGTLVLFGLIVLFANLSWVGLIVLTLVTLGIELLIARMTKTSLLDLGRETHATTS